MFPFVISSRTSIGTSPDLEVVGVGPLTVHEVEAPDPWLSGSFMELRKGTATTLLLTVTLFILFISSDALDIGSSNMGMF